MPSTSKYSDPLTRNDIGLLVLRVAVGVTLCWNGLNIVFASDQFTQLGSSPIVGHPDLPARVLAGIYSIGGAMLVAGLLTPFGASAVLGSMLYAAVQTYSVRNDLFPSGPALQFPLILAAAALAVLLLGPGRVSVDGRFDRDEWPAAVSSVLVIAGIGGAIAAWVLVKGTNPLS
ncbi:DoxX family protein [Mycobacteroides salmoniphilum]|uniref:DoxX n=1 Tax=Mycobacteroides salmoniphilum TaxID=404941 RepID=A0A4R8SK06_9MYCO|nr:DoxX family protein [Mycobacteroides salmoniphilum]TDZ97626.1 DoxX [Mycobacteroides salmoniphilum]TEA01856.1 DoxX [Mycobacteroides salmoniphilum]